MAKQTEDAKAEIEAGEGYRPHDPQRPESPSNYCSASLAPFTFRITGSTTGSCGVVIAPHYTLRWPLPVNKPVGSGVSEFRFCHRDKK